MTQSLSLESRVARLEARNAITELSAQYAVACDVRDLDLLGSLFTEDAVLDTPNGSMQASGRAAIVALFERDWALDLGYRYRYQKYDNANDSADANAVFFTIAYAPKRERPDLDLTR